MMADRRELFLLSFNLRNGLTIDKPDKKNDEKEEKGEEKDEEKDEEEPLTITINDAYKVSSPPKVESVKISTPYRGKKPKWETLVKKIFTLSVDYGDFTEKQIANYIVMMNDDELSDCCDKLGLFQLPIDYLEWMKDEIPEIDNDNVDNITTYKMGFALKRMIGYVIDVLNRSPIH